jgi:micrococcal nuclease
VSLYTYLAVVRDVHDGDTLTVDVDLGWGIWAHGQKLRLNGINAPELTTAAGKESAAWLARQLWKGETVTILTEKDKTEKYGRMLTTVWDNDHGDVYGDSMNSRLISAGYAVAWDGKGPRP